MARKQQMLNDSSKTIGGAALLVVLLIVSAVLSSVYSNEESSGPVHSVQAGVGMVAAPLQFVGVGVAYAEDAAGDAIQNATASDSSYTQLRDENAQLKAQLAELQEYRGEAQRLQGLLDLSDKYDFSGVTGRVIGKGPMPGIAWLRSTLALPPALSAAFPLLAAAAWWVRLSRFRRSRAVFV